MTSITRQLIESHLVEGSMDAGDEIAIRVDQTLTQDATGTLVMLELEAMGIDRVRTDRSVQYVDHNLLQQDHRNGDDHRFLVSACRRFGISYSGPGNGVSHPVHQQQFGVPGATLLGSDSHTPAAGAIGMLAIGVGGLEVALAMAGEPYRLRMPRVWRIELTGELPDWVSAKDVILELLRRHDVDGAVGWVLEYDGPGLSSLSAMDRHVIANMGTELGATTTVFPADDEVQRYLKDQGRGGEFVELLAGPGADYDRHERIDLSSLQPLIAMPSSPGNVVPVAEVAGREIAQAYVGSSANPGYRDFAIVAEIVGDRAVHEDVSLDINPTSRSVLEELIADGHLATLVRAGARIHQAGCNGCIGMGQAPATGTISLRTVPRNFPGRSGTREDQVCLVSPETAAASALRGVITDPRTLDRPYPRIERSGRAERRPPAAGLPLPQADASVSLQRGPGIGRLPELDPLPDGLRLAVLLKVDDDISTDEILPAGARVLPLRSNIPAIARFCFEPIDATYHDRAMTVRDDGGHAIVGRDNYGQGSSREHAALAPRYLGLRMVLAVTFARIHRQNLVNYGVLPVTFADAGDADRIDPGDTLGVNNLHEQLHGGDTLRITAGDGEITVRHDLSRREIDIVLAGGMINFMRDRFVAERTAS